MNTISRGIRNAFRNNIRTISIVAILGLSIGLALAMLVARASVQEKVASIKSSIGNTIAVAPAGLRGFQGGGEPLTDAQISTVANLAHVTKVTGALSDRLASDATNLVASIEAGSFGRRSAATDGTTPALPSGGDDSDVATQHSFTPPVTVTGVADPSVATVYGGDSVTWTSGSAFAANSSETVAVIGKSLAEKNSLSVGSDFTAYNTSIKVVGIYDAGNTFANGGLVMPLATLQKLAGLGGVTSATVTVDSADNLATTVTAIKAALGDAADVTSSQDVAANTVKPLEGVTTVATYSLVGAVTAGAVIILLTMMMIVRERRREIGVFKAVGASNGTVVAQFISEALTFTVMALVAGLAVGLIAAAPVTNALVSSGGTTSNAQAGAGQRPGGPGNFRQVQHFGVNAATAAKSVQASVGWQTVASGIGVAFIIAIVGSALPAFLISRVRPAEVMKAE